MKKNIALGILFCFCAFQIHTNACLRQEILLVSNKASSDNEFNCEIICSLHEDLSKLEKIVAN